MPHLRGERALGMVELIVVAVLLLVVLGVASMALLDGMGSQRSTRGSTEAAAQARDIAQQFAADVESAVAPHRIEPGKVKGTIGLGPLLADVPTAELDVHDVLEASDTAVLLRIPEGTADGETADGGDCVRWSVEGTTDGIILVRTTWAAWNPGGATCGGSAARRVLAPLHVEGGTMPAALRYRTIGAPDADGNCSESLGPLGAASTTAQRDRIVGIELDVTTTTAAGAGQGTAVAARRALIRGRQQNEYLQALGCWRVTP
jgi:hypothetical protein